MWVKRTGWCSGPISVRRPFIESRTFAALPSSWPSQISSSLLFSTPLPVGLAWVQSSIGPLTEGKSDRVSKSLLEQRRELLPGAHIRIFGTEVGCHHGISRISVLQPFHGQIRQHPLKYIITTAQLDVTGHCSVVQLASYNFIVMSRSRRLTSRCMLSLGLYGIEN